MVVLSDFRPELIDVLIFVDLIDDQVVPFTAIVFVEEHLEKHRTCIISPTD